MAEKRQSEEESSLIDPIYRKFVRGVTRAIGSTEFYEFFMDSVSRAENEFQFSNRKLIKTVDVTWVDAIEEALEAMQNIISSPRNVIKEEELVVNVANAKKAGAETVRHLAMHSSLVEDFDEERGTVRPSKLMQRYREDSIGLYENRLVFTTMEYAHHFVKVRHDALFEAMSDEFGAKLKVKSDMESATEHVHMDMFLHIKEIDSALETDQKNGEVFARISRIYRILSVYMNSQFSQRMAKLPRVKGTINKTNVLKRNPNYKTILKLWEFLKGYDDVGYTIRVTEQNPKITEQLQEDIYRNILFNYLILKGYLEDESDRAVPVRSKVRKRTLKPKIIHQIIEELTEDYDLPDVEVRKILIEELTKEQLMQEEASERLRLVEEQEKRREEEAERAREEDRLKKERLEKEKKEEEERRRQERKERDAEDRRRARILREELEYFKGRLQLQLEKRQEAEEDAGKAKLEDFANAAGLMEAEERRRAAEQYMQPYLMELTYFADNLGKRRELRRQQEEEYRQEAEERERLRRERLARKALKK